MSILNKRCNIPTSEEIVRQQEKEIADIVKELTELFEKNSIKDIEQKKKKEKLINAKKELAKTISTFFSRNEENFDIYCNNSAFDLHTLFEKLPRYRFPLKKGSNGIPFPKNGIYVFFEEGEKWRNFDRIVQMGTNKKDDELFKQLKKYINCKKRSKFRKHLGKALLTVNPSIKPYLEGEISRYLIQNMSFSVIEVENKEKRLLFKRQIIATLNSSRHFKNAISVNWLGRKSPKEKIANGGLWQTKGFDGVPFSRGEFDDFKILVLLNNY